MLVRVRVREHGDVGEVVVVLHDVLVVHAVLQQPNNGTGKKQGCDTEAGTKGATQVRCRHHLAATVGGDVTRQRRVELLVHEYAVVGGRDECVVPDEPCLAEPPLVLLVHGGHDHFGQGRGGHEVAGQDQQQEEERSGCWERW